MKVVKTSIENTRELYRKSFISHSAIKVHLIEHLKKECWSSIDISQYSTFTIPDVVFQNKQIVILTEIKPSRASINEIERGIGQVIIYLLHNNCHAMLVCAYEWSDMLRDIYSMLHQKRLHVLCYDQEGKWHRISEGLELEELEQNEHINERSS